MDAKVNILIDGGFYVQKFKEREGRLPNANDIENEIAVIMAETQKKTGADCKDILFRVFYYDCSPFDGKVKKPGEAVETDVTLASPKLLGLGNEKKNKFSFYISLDFS
ncbi:MAG: hypothetical protein K6B13_09170 [Prevotella sp.]|nr:hypothetical protein [Prevotella sp.]